MGNPAVKYRPDVDGLRAIAVVAVVLYHLGFKSVSGGFVGVDIFFVISGFLITSILIRDIELGRFSIVEFYARRTRRIIPPLIAVVAVSLGVGYLVLLPDDLDTLGKSALASVTFSSNVLFWLTQDYFDASADTNALLHTWSLAVEEQFYIVFPVMLLLISKANWSRVFCISALAMLSLILSVFSVREYPDMAFYLLPSRAWELLLGSLVAVAGAYTIESSRTNNLVAAIGLAAILSSIFFVDSGGLFPGETAIPVCVGTALVIHAGRGKTMPLANIVLGSRTFVFVGLISYSMYLWHWPAIIFTKYYLIRELTLVEKIVGLLIVTLMAYVSWRWIEQPFRDKKSRWFTNSRRKLFGSAACASVCIGVLGFWLHSSGGVPNRLSEDAIVFANARNDISPMRTQCHSSTSRVIEPELTCTYGDPSAKAELAVWGDSHSLELAFALGERAADRGYSLRHFSSSSCLPAYDLPTPTRPFCRELNNRYAEFIAADEDVKRVLLVAFYRSYRERHAGTAYQGLAQSIEFLQSAEKDVYVLLPVPFPSHNVPRSAALLTRYGRSLSSLDVPTSDHRVDHADIVASLHELAREYGATLIDPSDSMCDDESCRISDGRSLYFFDRHHLSVTGARKLALAIGEQLIE